MMKQEGLNLSGHQMTLQVLKLHSAPALVVSSVYLPLGAPQCVYIEVIRGLLLKTARPAAQNMVVESPDNEKT